MLSMLTHREANPLSDGATIEEICQLLGDHVHTFNLDDARRCAKVLGPLLDGVDEPVEGDRRLFLTGLTCDTPAKLRAALDAAAAAGAPGAVVKIDFVPLTDAEALCATSSLAVLVCDNSLSWRSIDDLVRVACRSVRAPTVGGSSAASAELFDLANEIAYAVGGAVTIEEPDSRLIAYSSLPHQEIDDGRRRTILGRRVPGEMREFDDEVHAATGVVHLQKSRSDRLGRMAVAVRYGSELLATIWVIEATQFSGEAEQALREAAVVTAVRLMRSRDATDPGRRARIDALMSLLDGGHDHTDAARLLGLEQYRAYAVVALCISNTNHTDELSASRLLEVAGVYCGAWQPSSVCVVAGTTVYALMPLSTTDGSGHLKRIATDIVQTAARTAGIEVRAAVGTSVHQPENIWASRRVADTVLAAINDPDSPQIATAEEVRSRVVLTELRMHTQEIFALGPSPAAELIQYDREHQTQFAASVLAWLDAFGDYKAAAAAIFVHENTLRYRVRKAEERLRLNLSDPHDRLVAWLELRLRTYPSAR